MSGSMKAATHMGPDYIDNLEIYKNTNFEELQNLFDITEFGIIQARGDFDCENDSMYISFVGAIVAGS